MTFSNGSTSSYLVRNPYSYCFRIKVPPDLQRPVGKKELRYSLKTGYRTIAKEKAHYLASKVLFIFRFLRRYEGMLNTMPDDLIQELVQQYIRNSLDRSEESFYADIDETSQFVPNESMQDIRDGLGFEDELMDDLKVAFSNGDFSAAEDQADTMLEGNDASPIEKHSPEYKRLCAKILEVDIRLWPILKKARLLDFTYRDDIPKLFPEIGEGSTTVSFTTDQTISEPLSEVIADYLNERESTWKPRSVPEIRRALKHLEDALGSSRQIHTVDAKAMREYKQKIRSEASKGGRPRSIKTINDKYLAFIITFFSFAVDNGYIQENPATGIKIKDQSKKKPHEQQDVFTKEDLTKMFVESPEFGKDSLEQPHQFWVPLIGLYTGMRLEEICQLYVDDLIQSNGVCCLDVSQKKPDQSVKTGERRLVPLHPFLVDGLNFVKYVKGLEDQSGRIFPKLVRVNNRYGHGIGQWFSKFREARLTDVKPRRKTFHSFRHTVINHLIQKDMPDHKVSLLVGHVVQGQTKGRYTKPLKAKQLFETIVKQIDYGINLSHLKNSKFVPK